MANSTRTICVAGASGLVGSNIVKAALQNGHTVRGTMRDAGDTEKTKYLMALEGAEERLTLFSANAEDGASFAEALQGTDAVAIACFPPIYHAKDGTPARELDRERGYAEIVAPVRDGTLNILEAARKAGVKTAVVCSSTSSTNPPVEVDVKHEATALSDAEHQMSQGKFTSAEKIVMERAAQDFCVRHNMRLCIMLPTMMLGPTILPGHLNGDSHERLVKMLRDHEAPHDQVPAGSMSVSHVQDVGKLFVAAIEKEEAYGRYFAVYDSMAWRDLYAEFARHVPEEAMPKPLDGEPDKTTEFDTTRRDSLDVPMRDIRATIAETFDWLKTKPFG